MRVQLRVARPRRAVPEPGGHEPLDRDAFYAVAAAAHEPGLTLEISDGCVDRRVVRCGHLEADLCGAERVEQRHRLRRRERRIETWQLPVRFRDARAVTRIQARQHRT
jgi:hypothetical protein